MAPIESQSDSELILQPSVRLLEQTHRRTGTLQSSGLGPVLPAMGHHDLISDECSKGKYIQDSESTW